MWVRWGVVSRRCVSTMDLHKVVDALQSIAPTYLAEKWDNVGLLVEPSPPHVVKRVLLTNDLTEDVLRESITAKADMIVSYHPPIFEPLKTLTSKSWKERIVTKCIENRIAIYSTHTATDAVQNGVNDWLAGGLGQLSYVRPIINRVKPTTDGSLLCDNVSEESIAHSTQRGDGLYEAIQSKKSCAPVHGKNGNPEQIFDHLNEHGVAHSAVKLGSHSESPIPQPGIGRLCYLKESTALKSLVQNVKDHLGLVHLRLAIARGASDDTAIKTVALCAGSGSSVLSGCKADLYLTGEMSHHKVLDATQNGISVILCEHSNSERGYLNTLRDELIAILGHQDLSIIISKEDKDPLKIV